MLFTTRGERQTCSSHTGRESCALKKPFFSWDVFLKRREYVTWLEEVIGHVSQSFTEEEPEIYDQAELDALFKACGAEERLWYEFFLMTGMREQEVMHIYWSDINFSAATVRVSHKPDRGWTAIAYKEREIPIPTKLVAALKEHKTKADKACHLVFPLPGATQSWTFSISQGCYRMCGSGQEQLLATQISRYIRDTLPMGGS